VIRYLQRYFSLALVFSLVAPLWVSAASSDAPSFYKRFHDALIWSAVLLGLWLLITKRRGFHIRGTWRNPELRAIKTYMGLLRAGLLIDALKCFFLVGTARTRSN
jgi:hypothetical protein